MPSKKAASSLHQECPTVRSTGPAGYPTVLDTIPSQGHCDALAYQTLHSPRDHLSTELLWAVSWLLRCCQGGDTEGMHCMSCMGRTSCNDPQVSFQFRVPRKPLLLTSLSDFSSSETEKNKKDLPFLISTRKKSPNIQRWCFIQYLTHLGSWIMVKITTKKPPSQTLQLDFLAKVLKISLESNQHKHKHPNSHLLLLICLRKGENSSFQAWPWPCWVTYSCTSGCKPSVRPRHWNWTPFLHRCKWLHGGRTRQRVGWRDPAPSPCRGRCSL